VEKIIQDQASTSIAGLLKEAKRFSAEGKREKAYRSSLEATNSAPDNPQAWYLRAHSAPSVEEKLICLSRVCSLDPAFEDAETELHGVLQGLLEQDPSLTYIDETDVVYQVRSGPDMLLNVPKSRAAQELYLQRNPGPLQPAFVWLNLSLLALFLGGVGAFFLAPMAVITAMRHRSFIVHRSDRARYQVLVSISSLIWLLSIPLAVLFLIHFMSWEL
jgi:hypothetical protein